MGGREGGGERDGEDGGMEREGRRGEREGAGEGSPPDHSHPNCTEACWLMTVPYSLVAMHEYFPKCLSRAGFLMTRLPPTTL